MSIEILQTGSMDAAVQGWMGSRTLREAASADEIATIDASVNELPTALFYCRDMMIVERELFVTPRNHVIWARTSRVDDPRDFVTPLEFGRTEHISIRAAMRHMADDGVHQDQWRLMLPLCATTSWTQRLSLRDAAKTALYLNVVAMAINNTRLAGRLHATATELFNMLPAAFGISPATAHKIIEGYKVADPFTGWLGDGEVRKQFGAFTQLQAKLPIALRAQLARHREIAFVDELIPLLDQPNSEQLPISTPITVQATAPTHVWRHVLGNRTCWMAQADLWAPLARLWGTNTEGLPCADGRCPYAEDAKQRIAGNDPGAPCPRYANLTKTPMTPLQSIDADLQLERMPVTVRPMWQEELNRARMAMVSARACVHAKGCPAPALCEKEGHCDAKFNGYR